MKKKPLSKRELRLVAAAEQRGEDRLVRRLTQAAKEKGAEHGTQE